MARAPMVTRTFKTTIAEVMCLDITKENSFKQVIILPRTYKNEKEILKFANRIIDTDDIKAVHVVNYSVVEQLYGMSEEKFLENAEKLPPRKANEAE